MFQWLFKPKNYEDRRDDLEPYILLMHYTGMKTMKEAKDRLSDPKSGVSVHYIIDEDGTTMDIVPDAKRAWHAGVSYWKGEDDINSASIGIEIVNPGHEFGYRAFPEAQMQAVLKLSRKIIDKHEIKYVLGHSDVAPERKQDPGELFDWEWLAANGVGRWPHPKPEDYTRAEAISRNDYEAEKLFNELGYNPMAAFQDVVTAFQRHYYPDVFTHGTEGKINQETIARLCSLLRPHKV